MLQHLTASKWRPRELVVSVIRQTTCQGEKAEIQDASVPESGGALTTKKVRPLMTKAIQHLSNQIEPLAKWLLG
ncbi:hypothetical protein ACLKA6_017959 [Drosophila palustris]